MRSQMTVTHISGQIFTLMVGKTVRFGADAPFTAAEMNPIPSLWWGGGLVFTELQADNRQNIPSAQLIYVDGRVFVDGCHMTFAPKFLGNRDDSHASNPCVSACEALVLRQE